jgi:hypothetical protein
MAGGRLVFIKTSYFLPKGKARASECCWQQPKLANIVGGIK